MVKLPALAVLLMVAVSAAQETAPEAFRPL